MLEFEITDRGFRVYTFRDHYDSECSIQESSLASNDCIWMGRDGHERTRWHLNQGMAEELVPLLQFFVQNGRLPDPAEVSDVEE